MPHNDKSPADLAREMLALLAKMTPGPWRADRNWYVVGPEHDWESTWPRTEGAGKDQRVAHVCGPGVANRAVADHDAIVFLRNNAEAICRRLVELEAQIGDPELLASFRRAEARDQLLEAASHEGSNALMREALGGLYSKLWGPDLERLGMAIDLVTAREKVALGRIAKLERVAEAAKQTWASLRAFETNDAYVSAEALQDSLADLEKP